MFWPWVFGMRIASFRLSIVILVCDLPVPYLFTLSHKLHDFWEKYIEQKILILIFFATSVSNISYSKKNSATCCDECAWFLM